MKSLKEFADGLKGLLSNVDAAMAADEEMEVDVARSGKFPSSSGDVDLSPKLLQELADTFDPTVFRPKNKLGHPSQSKTDEPAYGEITGIRYDKAADRLFVKTKPTADLRQMIAEKRRPERSMEYTPNYRGTGKARLLGLGWLGASTPAIDSLASLGCSPDGDEVLAFALGEAPAVAAAEPLPTPTEVLPEPKFASGRHSDAERLEASTKETRMAEEAVALAEKDKKIERLAKHLRDRAEESVDTYLARHKDKIPMALHKKGIKDVLMHFAAKEGDEGSTVNLALPGESQPIERSEYALVTALLAELPPLIAPEETKELAVGGADGTSGTNDIGAVQFADADPQSVEIHLAAQVEIFKAKSKGETLTYIDALRLVETARK